MKVQQQVAAAGGGVWPTSGLAQELLVAPPQEWRLQQYPSGDVLPLWPGARWLDRCGNVAMEQAQQQAWQQQLAVFGPVLVLAQGRSRPASPESCGGSILVRALSEFLSGWPWVLAPGCVAWCMLAGKMRQCCASGF